MKSLNIHAFLNFVSSTISKDGSPTRDCVRLIKGTLKQSIDDFNIT